VVRATEQKTASSTQLMAGDQTVPIRRSDRQGWVKIAAMLGVIAILSGILAATTTYFLASP
jgi:hypothetical protein